MGLVAGFQVAPGRIMGHAGAYTALGEGTAESKYRALEKAGVVMTNHPAKFGNIMKQLLGGQIGANPAVGCDNIRHRAVLTYALTE